jgi:PLP dependent protein
MNSTSLRNLKEEIRENERRISLVAVTKGVGINDTNEIIKAGVGAIGENRLEDAEKKFPLLLPADSTGSLQVEKHFIGRIQSRKIKRIVELFDCIQSVSSLEHLKKIENAALELRKPIKIFLQFNISGERQKGGFEPNEVEQVIKCLSSVRQVKIIGVMGMAEQTDDHSVVRIQFRLLRNVRDIIHSRFSDVTELSMGMSDDYKIALEEGATMLRIGRLLF